MTSNALVTQPGPTNGVAVAAEAPRLAVTLPVKQGIQKLLVCFAPQPQETDEDRALVMRTWAEETSDFEPEVVAAALRSLLRKNPRNPFRPSVQDLIERCQEIRAVKAGHAPAATVLPGGPYVIDGAGQIVFGPTAKFATMAFTQITFVYANMVLGDARKELPDATVQDVEEAFVEISDSFDANGKDVPIKKILEKAVNEIRRKHAYRRSHGLPSRRHLDRPRTSAQARSGALENGSDDAEL